MTKKTLVLGIGNTLLTDEGAGVRAVEHFEATHGDISGVVCLDGGTLSFTLAVEIEDTDRLIVIDAVQLHAEPGTVRRFVGDEMDRFVRGSRRTAHEVGLSDIMDMARMTNRLPRHRALIGVQFASTELAETLTEPVAAALPRIADLVMAQIREWDAELDP